jgi:hypothetical protein
MGRDKPTNQRTNQPTNFVSYRSACMHLKTPNTPWGRSTTGQLIGRPGAGCPQDVSFWPHSCPLITIHLASPWSWNSPLEIDHKTVVRENLIIPIIEKTKFNLLSFAKFGLLSEGQALWKEVDLFWRFFDTTESNLKTVNYGLHRLSHKLHHNMLNHTRTLCSKHDIVQTFSGEPILLGTVGWNLLIFGWDKITIGVRAHCRPRENQIIDFWVFSHSYSYVTLNFRMGYFFTLFYFSTPSLLELQLNCSCLFHHFCCTVPKFRLYTHWF